MKIAIVAGETSGDQLGGWLMESLKRAAPDTHFIGIGGERMQAQGLKSLFPMQDISLMGIAEILPHIFHLRQRIHETVAFIEREQPDVLVTIDVPGFVLRVLKILRAHGKARPRLIHYVAPTVWAYRAYRAATAAALYDHLLALFPFEPPYFEKEGLKTTCIGHEVAWWWKTRGDGAAFRARHGIAPEAPLLAIFPGSRHSELNYMLPAIGGAVKLLQAQLPELRVIVQVPPPLKARLDAETSSWPGKTLVLASNEEKKDFFAAATAALAKSGTIALECALAGLPSVLTYKANPITIWMVRRQIRIDYLHIANLAANREIIPELIQEECNPAELSKALLPLLTDETARNTQRAALADFARQLGTEDALSPSDKAAKIILGSV